MNKIICNFLDYFKTKNLLIKENHNFKNEIISLKKSVDISCKMIDDLNESIDRYEFLLDKDNARLKIEELEYLLKDYREAKRELREEVKSLKSIINSYNIKI